jgi:Domain of unknown function (DUF5914)/Rieske [2Fe-2S] domain
MTVLDRLRQRWPKNIPLQLIPPVNWADQHPTYRDARPEIIDAALQRSQRRPSGNWYAFAASRSVSTDRPFGTRVAGVDVVAWRDAQHGLHVGPAVCPHLGADLATGTVVGGALICHWHGLALNGAAAPATSDTGDTCEFGWKPMPSHDDGVLVWVRLDSVGGEPPLLHPVIPARPSGATLHAVTRLVGTCEPQDIIANRLDPWHGSWYHPYSFTRLEVLSSPSEDDDRFLVAVTFRIGRLGVPVIAEFTSPERRTIVMRIVDGEGAGSVVETHATPLGVGPDGHPRSAVLEAVIAHSDRPRFAHTRHAARLITPLMRRAATRLWRDDLAYAERRYAVRSGRA